MKNILMTLISLLLIVLTVTLMVNGISIGNIQISSIQQISKKNENLDKRIDETNSLNNITYKNALSDLNEATKKLATSKSNYLNIASVSSEAEIKEANQEKSYAMEYLWSQIGNHATGEGVNIKLEISSTGASNKNTLNFTVQGSYIAIRNFIYSLENDEDLAFKIENFKISGSGETLSSTFTVPDIGINTENISSSSSSSSKSRTENKTENSSNKDIASDRIQNAVNY